jgi:DNA-binding PadR family transcriptional regulator
MRHEGHEEHEHEFDEMGHGPGGHRRGHFRGGRGRGRGGRAQRGDVRIAVLLVLKNEPMHGYQVMNAISERTDGAWRPSPGAIYPTIAALEDEGFVTVTVDGGRKLVTITDAGREYIDSNEPETEDPFDVMKDEAGGKNDLRSSVHQLHGAARAVAESGSDDQLAAALKVIDQAKRSLYLILAGEEQA